MSGILRIVGGRIRASMLRLRGAVLGPKCLVGVRLHADHPRGITLGARVEMEQDVYLKLVADGARLAIDDFTFVGRGCEIDVALSVTVGAHTLVAPGVFITDHRHRHQRATRLDEQGIESAPVTIGADVWLGAGCTILPGITIGDGAIVGAGAVVTRDVDPYAIVAGVPARFLRMRD